VAAGETRGLEIKEWRDTGEEGEVRGGKEEKKRKPLQFSQVGAFEITLSFNVVVFYFMCNGVLQRRPKICRSLKVTKLGC